MILQVEKRADLAAQFASAESSVSCRESPEPGLVPLALSAWQVQVQPSRPRRAMTAR